MTDFTPAGPERSRSRARASSNHSRIADPIKIPLGHPRFNTAIMRPLDCKASTSEGSLSQPRLRVRQMSCNSLCASHSGSVHQSPGRQSGWHHIQPILPNLYILRRADETSHASYIRACGFAVLDLQRRAWLDLTHHMKLMHWIEEEQFLIESARIPFQKALILARDR